MTECQLQYAVHLLQSQAVVDTVLLVIVSIHRNQVLYDGIIFQHFHDATHLCFCVFVVGESKDVCQLLLQGFANILAASHLDKEVGLLLSFTVTSHQKQTHNDGIPV